MEAPVHPFLIGDFHEMLQSGDHQIFSTMSESRTYVYHTDPCMLLSSIGHVLVLPKTGSTARHNIAPSIIGGVEPVWPSFKSEVFD